MLLLWQDVVSSVFSGDDCCPGGSEVGGEVVGVVVEVEDDGGNSLGGDVDV